MTMNCFPYPGNKARHSKWILEHIPEHECYVELFGGAAGVLFNKPRSKIEVYNDLNGDIPHFFRVLRDRGDELQEWLENVPFSRQVHNEWATEYYDGHRPDDDIERAGRFFALRYMQYGGVVEKKVGFRNEAPYRSDGNQFLAKINALGDFKDRLRCVNIESMGAFDLIDSVDSKNTFFYADPPYEGTEGRYNSCGFNHQKLAEKAKQIDGDIAISYGTIPTHYGREFNISSKDSSFRINRSEGDKECTEYLIMNYDSKGEPIMSDVGQQTLV